MVASTLPSGGQRAATAALYSDHTRFAKRRHRDLVVGLKNFVCSDSCVPGRISKIPLFERVAQVLNA